MVVKIQLVQPYMTASLPKHPHVNHSRQWHGPTGSLHQDWPSSMSYLLRLEDTFPGRLSWEFGRLVAHSSVINYCSLQSNKCVGSAKVIPVIDVRNKKRE